MKQSMKNYIERGNQALYRLPRNAGFSKKKKGKIRMSLRAAGGLTTSHHTPKDSERKTFISGGNVIVNRGLQGRSSKSMRKRNSVITGKIKRTMKLKNSFQRSVPMSCEGARRGRLLQSVQTEGEKGTLPSPVSAEDRHSEYWKAGGPLLNA